MKEIKAYVRPRHLDGIIERLEEAGVQDLTVIRVDAFANLVDEREAATRLVKRHAEKYVAVAKLEIICRDDLVDTFVRIIQQHGHTGAPGDGRIFVTHVERAVNIRTGKEGDEAL